MPSLRATGMCHRDVANRPWAVLGIAVAAVDGRRLTKVDDC